MNFYKNRRIRLDKKKPGQYGPIKCRDCGRTDVTLVKCSDGHYICMDCIDKRR